ncbi:hypothetical protein SLS60_008543 [Paraconiothyrium brasiliense]|uniref:Uncharacterized protein n=1 Tax=Paraconiothyrium brasiliense TaxID=300254 RepID=A0ABR3R0W0_9PLEO
MDVNSQIVSINDLEDSNAHHERDLKRKWLEDDLLELYTPSVQAKIWSIAAKGLELSSPPTLYPEYTMPGGTHYIYRKADFWTSGFFPGSLHLLLERRKKFSHILAEANNSQGGPHLLSIK